MVLGLWSGGGTHGPRSCLQVFRPHTQTIDNVCYGCVHMKGRSHCFVYESVTQLHIGDGSQASHFISSDFMVHVSAAVDAIVEE